MKLAASKDPMCWNENLENLESSLQRDTSTIHDEQMETSTMHDERRETSTMHDEHRETSMMHDVHRKTKAICDLRWERPNQSNMR